MNWVWIDKNQGAIEEDRNQIQIFYLIPESHYKLKAHIQKKNKSNQEFFQWLSRQNQARVYRHYSMKNPIRHCRLYHHQLLLNVCSSFPLKLIDFIFCPTDNQDIDLKNLSLTKHYRVHKNGLLTDAIIHEAISDSECLSFNDINAIINTIEDESDSTENQDADDMAITRMIIGSDARIISDGPISSPSLLSTNLSIETPDTQYSGFMAPKNKRNQCDKIEEKCLEEQEEKTVIHNAEPDEDETSITVTYSNSIQNLNMIHQIKSVRPPASTGATTTSDAMSKQSPNEEYKENLMERDVQTPRCNNGISAEYEQNIKHLEQTGIKKLRRDSVRKLKKDRLVRSKRAMFENHRD